MAFNAILKRLTLLTTNGWRILRQSTTYVLGKFFPNNAILPPPKPTTSPSTSNYVKQYSMDGKIPIAQYEEIKNLVKHPEILLIDVREPNELRETGQIPTSINIPLGQVDQELAPQLDGKAFKTKYGREKPKLDTEIIFHCRLGGRSQKAAEAARKLGYKNVKNYAGSWVEWAEKECISK